MSSLAKKSILLIITGSIAAYKSADLIRRLQDKGATVRCVMTKAAQEFVTPLLMASLSGNEVYTDLFSLKDETEMGHIRLSRENDIVLVAPASANTMAKMAHGRADDLASTVLSASNKPIAIAPAMNPQMWDNAATQDNLKTLTARGVNIIMPAAGEMACGEIGTGRMAEFADIIHNLEQFFALTNALAGKRAIITAGPTYEPIDPVRFIGNFSSGKQGYAIAGALARAGADVTLITGPSTQTPPANMTIKKVVTAQEMMNAVTTSLPADIAVFAAAVADWRPASVSGHKIKKDSNSAPVIEMVENPDILKTVAHMTAGRPRLVIGFAAETNDLEKNARAKIQSKKCDWILANDVGSGTSTFGGDMNHVTLMRSDGTADIWDRAPKNDIATRLVQEIIKAFE